MFRSNFTSSESAHGAKHPIIRLLALVLASALGLAACSGGGTSTPTTSQGATPNSAAQVTGTLVDGYLQGATVFLDLNNNQVHDADEPISGLTDASGAFTISIDGLTPAQLAGAHFVADVPDTAKDADDQGLTLKQAGKQAFTLASPAVAYLDSANGIATVTSAPVVSPLTTLVSNEMRSNGLTLAQAKAAVQTIPGLEGRDLTKDFVANGDSSLGRIARTAAISLGEAGRAVAAAAAGNTGSSKQELNAAAATIVKLQLPTLITTLDNTAKSVVPVSSVTSVLAQADLRKVASDTIAAQIPPKPETSHFVVVFNKNVPDPAGQASALTRPHGGQVRFTYTRALKGFAVDLPAAAANAFLDAMQQNPLVDHVEVDLPVAHTQSVETSATWGLDRTDQHDLPLSGTYSWSGNGSGVSAFIIDTGIMATHLDFGGRVAAGFTAIADGNGTNDCNGHGTHVSGTVGSATWGMAKGVTLVPVRVLDCAGSGSTSTVIAGIDWMLANLTGPAVANLSLNGGASSALDSAVATAVSSGVTMVVAAGNANANACDYSPSREPSAITVGATTSADARASYSNFGTCLDVFAPGSSITSTWISSNTSTNVLNGTSMASPHVTGLAALMLQAMSKATPADITNAIKSSASANKVSSAGSGSANLFIFANAAGYTSATPPPPAPSVSVSVASLTGNATAMRNGWRATVTTSVKDSFGLPVAGAVVTGGFTSGGSSVSCTTMTNGSCSFTSGNISSKVANTTYTVSGLSGTSLIYDPSANVLSSVKIIRP